MNYRELRRLIVQHIVRCYMTSIDKGLQCVKQVSLYLCKDYVN